MTKKAEDGFDCVRIMREARHRGIVPKHRSLRLGTHDGILTDVVEFVGQSKRYVRETLFG